MTQEERVQFNKIITAIKNGAVLPADTGVKISYKGQSYLISDFYEQPASGLFFSIDGETNKIPMVKKQARGFSRFLPKTWTEVTIQNYSDKDPLLRDREHPEKKVIKYTGFCDKVLIFYYLRNFQRS